MLCLNHASITHGLCLTPAVSTPFRRSSLILSANVIRSVTDDDVQPLANLCADALYGEAELLKDGPIIWLQRKRIVRGMRSAFTRRIGFESNPEYGVGDDQELKFFIAEDESSGEICGCLDMAIHLFDASARAFELEEDEMPEDPELRYRWSPYIASLSVSRPNRGAGVGRQLVLEAEAWAKRKGYGEVMLEVRLEWPASCGCTGLVPGWCSDE